MSAPLGVQGVHHIGISVPDIAKAREFYIDLLGAVEEVAPMKWRDNPSIDAIIGLKDSAASQFMCRLGKAAQIGVTCHGSRHLALEAAEAGADYVAFGAFYPTTTKRVSHAAKPALLRWWHVWAELPSVAIGGITLDNAVPLIEAGADFLAVSAGVWQHPEGPEAAVAAFGKLVTEHRSFDPRAADLAAIMEELGEPELGMPGEG